MASKKRALGIALGSAVCLAALGGLPALRPPATPDTGDLSRALAAANAPKVAQLYDRWVARHEARGGDRNVVVPLGPGRGLTTVSQGRGVARLDLLRGSVEVGVAEMAPGSTWDVWIVDNRDAGSALVDGGDARIHVGGITAENGTGSLRAELGADALRGFEVDVVMVTAAGADPTAPGALYGLQTAFQRLYTRTRQDNLVAYADETATGMERLLARLGASDAHAAGTAVDPDVILDQLVEDGAEAFINETFDGNGRTCASCHPPSNNFTIDVPFIAGLPASDPLFVAEQVPALATLENSARLRSDALVTENVDGFDNPGVLRSTPHTLAMASSIDAPSCVDDGPSDQDCTLFGAFTFAEGQQAAFSDISTPLASGFPAVDPFPGYDPTNPIHDILVTAFPAQRTGWGGDGAPLGGTLRDFAIGAVVQHFPQTLDRVAGVDFRLPTDDELDAMEVFQLSLGREADVHLASMTFTDPSVENGKQVFRANKSDDRPDGQAGKCETCHDNAGANSMPDVFGDEVVVPLGFPRGFGGNFIFDTGVTDFTEAEGSAIPDDFEGPPDGGLGIRSLASASDCTTGEMQFVTPPGAFPPGLGFHPFNFVVDDPVTPPGGFGSVVTPIVPFAGLCQLAFNAPPLVEAADTAPFFHDNSASTIEDAVRFYTSPAFNDEVGNKLFLGGTDVNQVVIDLSEQSVLDIAAFLRVLNAVENIRQADELGNAALEASTAGVRDELLAQMRAELADAQEVLAGRGLHAGARGLLGAATAHGGAAQAIPFGNTAWEHQVVEALDAMNDARDSMVSGG